MNAVEKLQKHLQNCSKILDKFIETHKINESYLVIKDVISQRSHGKLNLRVMHEFDDLTVKEVNVLLSNLHDEFRIYLEKNKIEYSLHINSVNRGWAVDKIVFHFEIKNQ